MKGPVNGDGYVVAVTPDTYIALPVNLRILPPISVAGAIIESIDQIRWDSLARPS
jgi:hypothetical protein